MPAYSRIKHKIVKNAHVGYYVSTTHGTGRLEGGMFALTRLNKQAKDNEARFPEDFRFQLTQEEHENLLFENRIAKLVASR